MNRFVSLLGRASLATLLVFPAIASAALITFDENPPAFQQGYGDGSAYVEGDYMLASTSDPGRFGSLIRFNPDSNAFTPDNGSIHMGATLFSNPWLQRSDGGAFDLFSLEIGEYSRFVSPPDFLSISALTLDGQVLSAELGIDGIFDRAGGVDDFQFYALNWSNVVRVDFNDTLFSVDNIHVGNVPEPALLSILLVGLAGLGMSRKLSAGR